MFRKKQNDKARKYNSRYGKGGFTLVELCITMAIVAILGTMVVSFAVMMGGAVNNSSVEYAFLEEHSQLKEGLSKWIAENDLPGNEFSADINTLTVSGRETVTTVNLARNGDNLEVKAGEMLLGSFENIDGASFFVESGLVKCVTYREDKNGGRVESSFVVALRLGSSKEVGANE